MSHPRDPELGAVIPLLYRAGFRHFSFTAEAWSRDVQACQDGGPVPGSGELGRS